MKNLHLSFDVGHSSLGWAVLQHSGNTTPTLLGCGAVIFQADDCLASQRRGFRRQRRHIRATRMRIERMKRLFAHLGVLTREQLDTPGCAWPWLLVARVLRGGPALTWPELWDVLRWYAHNRGYDGNKGWSRQDAVAANAEDTEKEQRAHELLNAFAKKHGRAGTMAEVFCDVLRVDPLKAVKSSMERVRNLGAAFPREGVEAEVERILRAHPACNEAIITALMRDHTAIAGPDFHLPKRYGQRVNGKRTPGGLLFGQLVPRFDNRIIATCPITFQRERERVLAETGDPVRAKHEAEKLAKVPGIACPEFYRFRWAMQIANVQVATANTREPRRLSIEERGKVNDAMQAAGSLTPTEFKKIVRALTDKALDNLDRLLALPDADKSLILDPARKLASGGVLGVLWPALDEKTRAHTLTNLRRGKSVTARALLDKVPAAQDAFDHWWDGEAMKKPRKPRKADAPEPLPRTREQALNEPHSLGPMNGRAAYTREVMKEVVADVLEKGIHPMDEGGVLFRSEPIRHAQLQRALDEQTNNHLVRHRLKLLERLHADLLKEYADGENARIARITIEVNRSVKELSGKTAQEQAKEQGQQTAHFRSVEKKLAAAYEGLGVQVGPGLIRKGRIAEDLAWTCPYTGKVFDAVDLLRHRVDKDHIIPRSQRASDSLDSLVVTFSEINKWKGNRTAVQFVEEEQGKPVPGLPNLMIKSLSNFVKDVDALKTYGGHDDDQRRKENRKRLLKLRDYVEKEFTPGDLTKTSQLVRLGAEALARHYLGEKEAPVITSLPGSVTGAVRKSWQLAGCLSLANPNVMNPEDLAPDGSPKVHRKTELRGITHLHHALDACVLGFTSLLLPRDGGTWKKEVIFALQKRRCNATEQGILRAHLGAKISFTQEGEPRLKELDEELCKELRQRLAERRVAQHIPASMADMVSDQTVWRAYDPADRHPNAVRLGRWLAEAGIAVPEPEAKTTLIICRKRKAEAVAGAPEAAAGGKVFHETKTWRWVYDIKAKDALLGFAPTGDPADWKLKPYKAVKVLGDNFGLALDPEPTLIRPLHVWRQLVGLRKKNGGKWPRVIRIGSLIRVQNKSTKADYRGTWMLRGIQLNQKSGLLVDLSPADQIIYRGKEGSFQQVSVATLRKCGLEILRASLTGVMSEPIGQPKFNFKEKKVS